MSEIEMTNIAIKVGVAETKASISLFVACIGAAAAIISAIIAGYFKVRLDKANKEYQQQWAFIGKKTTLFDVGIEICCRMLWNKILLADNVQVDQAKTNLFLLEKDCLAVESQLLLYGDQKLSEALYLFKIKIKDTPDKEIREKWDEVIELGRQQIVVLREDLVGSITEKYEAFANKLTAPQTTNINAENVVKNIGSKNSVTN